MLQKSSKAPHACRVSSAEFAGASASIHESGGHPSLEVYHQLTDNVAESHKQGTTILLYNGWLDPVSSEFWVDQLSLTLHRGSTPSVISTIRVLSPPSC